MDEPLSNLDAKLRVQMRAEVARIQRRIGVATIYVTHDQVEAMTMGDRSPCCGRHPSAVRHPAEPLRQPGQHLRGRLHRLARQNLYDAVVAEGARSVKLGSQEVELPEAVVLKRPGLRAYAGKALVVGLRPEHLPAAAPGYTGPQLAGDVDLVEALGSELVVHFTIDAHRVIAEGAVEKDEAAATASGEGVARVAPRLRSRSATDDLRRRRRGHAVLRPKTDWLSGVRRGPAAGRGAVVARRRPVPAVRAVLARHR